MLNHDMFYKVSYWRHRSLGNVVIINFSVSSSCPGRQQTLKLMISGICCSRLGGLTFRPRSFPSATKLPGCFLNWVCYLVTFRIGIVLFTSGNDFECNLWFQLSLQYVLLTFLLFQVKEVLFAFSVHVVEATVVMIFVGLCLFSILILFFRKCIEFDCTSTFETE